MCVLEYDGCVIHILCGKEIGGGANLPEENISVYYKN